MLLIFDFCPDFSYKNAHEFHKRVAAEMESMWLINEPRICKQTCIQLRDGSATTILTDAIEL